MLHVKLVLAIGFVIGVYSTANGLVAAARILAAIFTEAACPFTAVRKPEQMMERTQTMRASAQ